MQRTKAQKGPGSKGDGKMAAQDEEQASGLASCEARGWDAGSGERMPHVGMDEEASISRP
jgi:hypothetical protein